MEHGERQPGWTEQAQRIDRTRPQPANQPDGAFVYLVRGDVGVRKRLQQNRGRLFEHSLQGLQEA